VSTDLIAALQNPTLYSHQVNAFEVRETHISWVILTGDYAYKIKKPMNFGFLDFTSLEKRKHFCKEELRLNKRLAPSLYLGVYAITGSPESPHLVAIADLKEEDGAPFEYVVKMKQFSQTGLFDHMQGKNQLTPELMQKLAVIMADFHQNIAEIDTKTRLGSPDDVYAPVKQNFEQILPLLDSTEQKTQLKQLEGWAESTFQRLLPLFEKRKEAGFIRECHGDAHLGNITLYQNEPVLFDCIEFNQEFRWIDVISDVAFLVMDLEDRGETVLAQQFLNTYLEHTGDYEGLRLLDFYKAYRAMVRAKVSLFTLGAPNLDEASITDLKNKYQNYADLAESYSIIPLRFALMMHGLSGTGKTTVSNGLIQSLNVIRVRSDIERKRLYGFTSLEKSNSDVNQGLYSLEITQKTYQHLVKVTGHILGSGRSVLIDGTHLLKWQREALQNTVDERGVPLLIISCQLDENQAKEWIEKRRKADDDASEADTSVYEKQKKQQDPLEEDELKHCLPVATDDEEAKNQLAKKILAHLGLQH